MSFSLQNVNDTFVDFHLPPNKSVICAHTSTSVFTHWKAEVVAFVLPCGLSSGVSPARVFPVFYIMKPRLLCLLVVSSAIGSSLSNRYILRVSYMDTPVKPTFFSSKRVLTNLEATLDSKVSLLNISVLARSTPQFNTDLLSRHALPQFVVGCYSVIIFYVPLFSLHLFQRHETTK